eukprot:gene1983-2250_t
MAFPGLCARRIKHKEQRKLLHTVVSYPIKETWTHDFCCLPFRHQETTPTPKQADLLQKGGLGKTKVVFENKNATHAQVIEKLQETFSQTKPVGGFTLHRAKTGGQNRPLILLSCQWCDIKSLRQEVTGSACIYIHSLQKILNLSLRKQMPQEDTKTAQCELCKRMVPLKEFASHEPCSAPESLAVDEIIEIDDPNSPVISSLVKITLKYLCFKFEDDVPVKNDTDKDSEVDLHVLHQNRLSYLCPESAAQLAPPDEFQDSEIITLHRANLQIEMIAKFSEDVRRCVEFSVYDSSGKEELGKGKGVTRDI